MVIKLRLYLTRNKISNDQIWWKRARCSETFSPFLLKRVDQTKGRCICLPQFWTMFCFYPEKFDTGFFAPWDIECSLLHFNCFYLMWSVSSSEEIELNKVNSYQIFFCFACGKEKKNYSELHLETHYYSCVLFKRHLWFGGWSSNSSLSVMWYLAFYS